MTSATRFAAAMAERLSEIVPPGFSVRVHSAFAIDIIGPDGDDRHADATAVILDLVDRRSPLERAETAASAILSGAQDAVMERLTEQWPLTSDGRWAAPGVATRDGRIEMWFGDEAAPVLRLRSIDPNGV